MIGVQLFTVKEYCKTPEALRRTIIKLHSMGFKTFELSRIQFSNEELEVLKLLKSTLELTFTTCQVPLPRIKKDFEALMNFCKALDIKSIEISVIPIRSFLRQERGLIELAEELNALGKRTKTHNVNLLYHHHHYELIQLSGKLGLDILLERTHVDLVNFVVDTYWLARSGLSPESYILRHRNRIKGIHLRDCMQYYSFFGFKFKDCTLGKGTVDFHFVKALEGVFMSIEEATNQPFVALNESLNYLKGIECVSGFTEGL